MIRIEHSSNPLNYGTNMMVTNFMYYLDKFSNKKNEYELDVFNDSDLDRYRNQYLEGNINKRTIDYGLIYSENVFQKAINKLKRNIAFDYFHNKKINELIKNTENLIILGGDDLSEYYGLENLKREFNRLNNVKDSMNVFLVGQTIGPFYEDRINLAKKTLNNLPIYSRDPWTTEYLKENLKVEQAIDSRDLALIPLPYQENKEIEDKILRKYGLIKEQYLTLVPSGLYESYCKNIDSYIDNWVEIINYLRKSIPDKEIVLLPHVLRYEMYDDRNIIRKLESKFKEDKKIKFIYDEMMPLQARFILGNGIFTITGRMHGAISTLQMRKPAISISYSVKYNGVIGEGLNLKDLIVEGKNDELWETMKVSNDTFKKINYVMDNYSKIIKDIDSKVTECEVKVFNMIEDISKQII
ncbi:polysaccharide pyruvyl transferase family protein [Clostridium perfringens]|nr:polysaccharide pyruvyl transferase family protein [Clostridium perfringens]